jgi:ATPase subunit of ABC transporter with duplicated ATPase domains
MNILEQFLEQYEGCLLLVSHDRYFMDKTVDSLFIMEENGDISGFVGKCSEYIEYREELKKNAEDEAAEVYKEIKDTVDKTMETGKLVLKFAEKGVKTLASQAADFVTSFLFGKK